MRLHPVGWLRHEGSRNRRGTALLVLGGLSTAVGLLGVAAHVLNTSSQVFTTLAAFAPYLLTGSGAGLILLFFAQSRIGVLVAVLVVAAGIATEAPLYVASTASRGTPFMVMQANLKLGTASAHALAHDAAAFEADLLTVEELTPQESIRLSNAGLNRTLPYHFSLPEAGGSGIGLWSRYPLSNTVLHAGYALGVLSATMTLPTGRTVTVLAAHINPPYPQDPARWRHEMAMLHTLLAGFGGAVVIGGDFNSTDDHAPFRALLSGGYGDAARQAGVGIMPTFPADRSYPPLIGIDHVLLHGAVAADAETFPVPGSDHRGVVVRVGL